MTDELKPCPFCGFSPEIDEADFLYPLTRERDVWGAHCYETGGGCGLCVVGDSKEGALKAWKRRSLLAAGASEGQAEPVGYAAKCEFDENGKLYDAATVNFRPEDGDVPLYTHPSADEFCKAYAEEWQDTLKEQSDCIKARDAEIAALRERIAGMEKDADRPVCVDCGDSIMAHDPGVCGNCYSMKYAKEPK